MINDLLLSSSRVALAAFLHDLGKFAERARIPEAAVKDSEGNSRRDINVQLACPQYNGRHTHIHAAYTAIGMDLLEDHLPEIVGEDMTPFAPWKDRSADDSLINAAARHHRPDTLLQWVIATADRLASGFERETFDNYNALPDEAPGKKLDHYTTRQETLLERIRLDDRPETSQWRYPLKPFSPNAIFPLSATQCEHGQRDVAQKEYFDLWQAFQSGLAAIPQSHRKNLALWLDHFESLWLTFTHSIPSATVGLTRPDVSLYDHSKTTAALAVALWRFHADSPQVAHDQLRAQWDRQRASSIEASQAWDEEKFLLIQGDFFGIQNFIFAEGSQTQKRAAKLIRGRSFYVSLLSELAALKVLEVLDLPSTSQVVNAAGKFLIVAPNTVSVVEKLEVVRSELDKWFLEHTYGQSGIGLTWLAARAKDFRQGVDGQNPFGELMRRLFEQLDVAKHQRFRLCAAKSLAIFSGFLDRFTLGECQIDGRFPAEVDEGGIRMTNIAADQIDTGKWLATHSRVLITRSTLNHCTLRLPIFGYCVNFTQGEEDTGKFGPDARSGNLVRAWDFSLPDSATAPLWNGYARRHINAYVPRFDEPDSFLIGRYQNLADEAEFEAGEIKTFGHIACEDRQPIFHTDESPHEYTDSTNRYRGVAALIAIRGDVDNLGKIFRSGLKRPTFTKMAALSRQMNAFFAVYLPWLCQSDATFRNVYTVFAGGDDFFLIGPWHSTIKLAQRMRLDFRHYVAENPDVHFSAGLSMTKPGLPIRQMAALAESSLDEAKQQSGKDSVVCFGQSVKWSAFTDLLACEADLNQIAQSEALSTSYLYGLLRLADMASDKNPENSIWHSYFRYRTRRLVEARFREMGDRDERESARSRLQSDLAKTIAVEGIQRHGADYKIALFTYLYQQRE